MDYTLLPAGLKLLDDVIQEKDKKRGWEEEEKKKGSLDSDNDDVRGFLKFEVKFKIG